MTAGARAVGAAPRPRGAAFDHLVVGCASLAQAEAWAEDLFGQAPPFGGAHPRTGTYNSLCALGPASFCEMIAIDPAAAAPNRARWFGLDEPATQARLAERPTLLTWVINAPDIEAALGAARAAGVDLGEPAEMTRGGLNWRFSLRDDGALPEGGTVPMVIEWGAGEHPATRMADLGWRLPSLTLRHPEPERLRAVLSALGVLPLVRVETAPAPGLVAAITLPKRGAVRLESAPQTSEEPDAVGA